jgi:lysophospholipase L1-like esterase
MRKVAFLKKVRKLFVLSLAAVIASTLLSTGVLAKSDSNQGKQSLVALGDSISFGYNLGVNNNHPSKDAFPYVIGGNDNLRVRDLAEAGWTTTDLLNALDTSKYQEALKHTDVVTLDIGNNDLLHAASAILQKISSDPNYHITLLDQLTMANSIQQIQTNLPLIIAKIRQHTSTPIVIYTLYNPFPKLTIQNYIGELFIPTVNKIILGEAFKSNLLVADAYSAFSGHEIDYVRVLENDVHPTIEGQKVLADIAINKLNITP